MPHYQDERCTECNNICSKLLLTAKRVQFVEVVNQKKVLKSRVTAWLCEECRDKDPDWLLEPKAAAPGYKSAGLERVRAAQKKRE
jgi:hypothetical protein